MLTWRHQRGSMTTSERKEQGIASWYKELLHSSAYKSSNSSVLFWEETFRMPYMYQCLEKSVATSKCLMRPRWNNSSILQTQLPMIANLQVFAVVPAAFFVGRKLNFSTVAFLFHVKEQGKRKKGCTECNLTLILSASQSGFVLFCFGVFREGILYSYICSRDLADGYPATTVEVCWINTSGHCRFRWQPRLCYFSE